MEGSKQNNWPKKDKKGRDYQHKNQRPAKTKAIRPNIYRFHSIQP